MHTGDAHHVGVAVVAQVEVLGLRADQAQLAPGRILPAGEQHGGVGFVGERSEVHFAVGVDADGDRGTTRVGIQGGHGDSLMPKL